MRLFIFIFLIFGETSLARAQTNPFRALRDGGTKLEASERFLDPQTALPVMRSWFTNYQFIRFNKVQFFEKVTSESFFQESLKRCRRSPKNVAHSCTKQINKDLIVLLRVEKIIDDVAYLILENHLEHPFKESKEKKKQKPKNKHALFLDLNTLEQKYFFIELKREEINPQTASMEFAENPMATKDFKSKFATYKKLTPRQRLYLTYNHEQIIKLAEIVKYASQVMNSKSIRIVFDEDGDGIEDLPAIEASYSEKYRLAIKLIKRELNREVLNGVLIGKQPNFTDLLAASMEAGFFTPEELKIMLDFPELRDPKPENWKKAGKIAWLVARAGLLAIPGFGTVAAIPIVIIEAIIEGSKKNNENVDTTDNIF